MTREIVEQLLDSQTLLEGIWEAHSNGDVSAAEMLELAGTLGRTSYIGLIRKGVDYLVGDVEYAKETEAKVAAAFAEKMGLDVTLEIRPKATPEELETAWKLKVAKPIIVGENIKKRGRPARADSEPGAPLAAVKEALDSLGITSLEEAGTFTTSQGTDGEEHFVSGQCDVTSEIQQYCVESTGHRYKGSMPAAVWRLLK